MLDLTRKKELDDAERLALRVRMQACAVSALGRVSGWPRGDLVLHGGNGIRLGLGGDRQSEDLDFYLRDERWRDELKSAVERAAASVAADMGEDLPGSEVSHKAQKLKPGPDGDVRTASYLLRWSHKARQGAMKTKLEFCRVPGGFLARYPTGAEAEGVATCAASSAWADKVVSSSMRPYVKWRDLYDIAWLRDAMDEADREVASGLVGEIAGIYGYDPTDVASGLREKLDGGAFHDVDAFRDGVAGWLEGERAARFDAEAVLDAARGELELGARALDDAPARGAGPK